MTQYLVAIHLPDDFDPSAQDKQTEHDIDVVADYFAHQPSPLETATTDSK